MDVRAALTSALALAEGDLKTRCRVVTSFGEVPPVRASHRALAEAFLNLLANAADAIPPGRVGEVCVRTAPAAGGRVAVEVADDGEGMTAAVRARAFEPFFTTKAVGAGVGLGLSVCHGIVAGLGGEIEVESEEGRGAVFRVLLPAAEEDGTGG